MHIFLHFCFVFNYFILSFQLHFKLNTFLYYAMYIHMYVIGNMYNLVVMYNID